MPSIKEYLNCILDQLSGLPDISHLGRMGEYIIYYRGRIVGGIYYDRFLVKPVAAARALMPDAPMEIPYPGLHEMLLVTDVDNPDFLCELFNAMYDELPIPTLKRTGKK